MQIDVVQTDITGLHADAIVNAANSELISGGGVCGAIHAKAGYGLADECAEIGHCDVGDAIVTGAFEMQNAKWIIHAVGPVYGRNNGKDAKLLESTYRSIFRQCMNRRIEMVAIPCISTGIYGYPKEDAAQIAYEVARNWMEKYPSRTTFCCYCSEDFRIYQRLTGVGL